MADFWIKDGSGKDNDITIWGCPRCNNGKLIKRRDRYGHLFLGCTEYPHCLYTQSFEKGVDDSPMDVSSFIEEG